jgi:cyclopropane fatty-acyl-phospholipid synthase-like methyltransferase
MNNNPVDLLFGGMQKLGPGEDRETLHVLQMLPKQSFRVVVDAGCGTGRQTLSLAKCLGTMIHAVDNHQPFLDELMRRTSEAKLEHLVEAHCMDMKDIPQNFQGIDLLWSEGAAYNIGFSSALAIWRSALAVGGLAAISELSWLKKQVPETVSEFFCLAYPGMQSVEQNITAAEKAGYRVLATHVLPRQAWVDGYYDVLAPRAKALLEHSDNAVRSFAAETIKEIEIFERSENSYGYVFYSLERI